MRAVGFFPPFNLLAPLPDSLWFPSPTNFSNKVDHWEFQTSIFSILFSLTCQFSSLVALPPACPAFSSLFAPDHLSSPRPRPNLRRRVYPLVGISFPSSCSVCRTHACGFFVRTYNPQPEPIPIPILNLNLTIHSSSPPLPALIPISPFTLTPHPRTTILPHPFPRDPCPQRRPSARPSR